MQTLVQGRAIHCAVVLPDSQHHRSNYIEITAQLLARTRPSRRCCVMLGAVELPLMRFPVGTFPFACAGLTRIPWSTSPTSVERET